MMYNDSETAKTKKRGMKKERILSFRGDTSFPEDTFLSSDIISELVGLSLYKIAGLIVEDYSS